MPRTNLLASALVLALGATTAVHAQSFSGVVTIGDSLSDSGNIAALFYRLHFPAGNGFTTNPDPVYAEIVAAAFGYTQTNYSPYVAGSVGSDYAVGGACVRPNSASFVCVNDISGPLGRFSLTNQLNGYLADPARGGHADPNGLYMMWGGGNDIDTASRNPVTAEENVTLSADAMVGLIGTLQNAGARTIVVINQYGTSHLTAVFNTTFNAGLANLGDGIVPINVSGLFNEFVADPGRYGFVNVTDPACGVGSSSVVCGTDPGNFYTYAPGTDQTYLFADGAHPSGGAHARLASVVLATLSAPGEVSMAGELPLQTYDDHSRAIEEQIFGASNNTRASGDKNVYGRVQSGRQQFAASANTNAMDNDQFTGTLGVDLRYDDAFTFGAAVSFGDANGDNGGASIDGSEVLVSAYGIDQFGSGYVDAIVSGGRSELDIDRRIALGGPSPRIEHGRTHASHQAIELGGGFTFGSDRLRHGPFARLTWQKIDVHGYAEDSLDSTAMNFDDFSRRSMVGRVGYQAQCHGGRWQPFGRMAYARDSRHDATAVRAGSNTMNGHFTLDGFQAARDWFEADLGVNYALSDKAELSLSYRARLQDDTQDLDSVNFGLRMTF